MKKVLITGGAGFIGSNLTKKVLDLNQYNVTSVDNFDSLYSRQLKERNIEGFLRHENYCFIEGDIRNINNLEIHDIDIIIHLAAKAGVRKSIMYPIDYQDINIGGTQNLLEYARQRKIKKFVFASSSSVYGVNPNTPWSEEEKLLPISPYAYSKLSNEMLGYVYSHLYNIQFLALRFFTVYGPGQRPDLAIHKFFDLIHKRKPIPVFGNGNSYRDYTYIDDIVNGIIASLEYDDTKYEIINLGCTRPITLNDLINNIELICGINAIIERKEEQPGDLTATFADISKAQKLLNYHPSTDLNTGLRSFYNWFIKQDLIT